MISDTMTNLQRYIILFSKSGISYKNFEKMVEKRKQTIQYFLKKLLKLNILKNLYYSNNL